MAAIAFSAIGARSVRATAGAQGAQWFFQMTHPSTEERAQLSILELSATEMLHRCLTFRGCSCRKTARAGSPSSSLHSGSSASRIPNHQACLSLRARATPALARPQPALTHRDGVRTRCSNVRGGHGSGRYPHYRVIATFTLTGTTTTVISRISHLAPRARSGQRRDMRDARRDIWKERSRCARHSHSKGIAVSYWPLGADVTAAPRAMILLASRCCKLRCSGWHLLHLPFDRNSRAGLAALFPGSACARIRTGERGLELVGQAGERWELGEPRARAHACADAG